MPPSPSSSKARTTFQHSSTLTPHLPFVLLVLDGWGVAAPSRGNAISLARTPHLDQLMNEYPTVSLHAAGEMVGLPWKEMGNSEVGHLNIGSGKIIYQNLPLINKAIAEKTFFQNPALLSAIAHVKKQRSRLHIIGLVSDGNIHASRDHLYALLDMCTQQQLTEHVFVHAILDGRDTSRTSGMMFVAQLETFMQERGVGSIATLAGRFYAMDRDNHWDRTERTYRAMRFGESDHRSDSPLKAIERSYTQKVYDEEFFPTVITHDDDTPVATIEDNDAIIFVNFRPDRARQLTKTFILPGFQKFDRGPALNNLVFVSMTEYEKNLPLRIAFTPDTVQEPVAKVVADAGLKQLHIAETEKYAHVTFFFNGGQEQAFPGEERALIPSPRVTAYDAAPEMSIAAITQRIEEAVTTGSHDCIVANIANADMVGHTGNIPATITAIEVIDREIGRVVEAVQQANGSMIITADHGNAEDMLNLQTGAINKEHSTNPVPCILVHPELRDQRSTWPAVERGDLSRLHPMGVLSDVGPTILVMMGLPVPSDMTGRTLVR